MKRSALRYLAIWLGESVFVLAALWLAFLPSRSIAATPPPQFAFWYERWSSTTWSDLAPATAVIYSPDGTRPDPVAGELHQHGGLALPYVTLYQSTIGGPFLSSLDDLRNVGFGQHGRYLPSAFGDPADYVLCSNSVEVRRRVLAYVDDTIANQKYDGLFIDNAYQPPATTSVCDAPHAHVVTGRAGGPAYLDLLAAVVASVKAKNPKALVITNAGNPRLIAQLSSGGTDLWSLSDFSLWESFAFASEHGAEHDRLGDALAQGFAVASGPHARNVIALAYPRTYDEALVSFGLARVFGFLYAANLGVDQVDKPDADGGHYGLFLQRLPLQLGDPTSPVPPPADRMLRRSFANGEVVVNLDAAPADLVARRPGTLITADARRDLSSGTRVTVAPGHAAIAVYESASGEERAESL